MNIEWTLNERANVQYAQQYGIANELYNRLYLDINQLS